MGSRMVWPLPYLNHPLAALENKLQERYRLKETDLCFHQYRLRILSIADLDELLDQVVSEDDIPFWAELWPSALGLLSYLEEFGNELKDTEVLELGCGTGLVGIGVQLCDGRLTQSDYVTDALQFAAVNASRNNLQPALPLQADWRNFTAKRQFRWILGSDILYEKKLHPFLKTIFGEYLEPQGHLLIADPGRAYAKDFMESMAEEGWTCQHMTRHITMDGREHAIDIYRLIKAV